MSKKEKVTKITQLTQAVASAAQDIECLGLLHKIVVLQLNQAAIQFFKRDKFTTYNHTVNLYVQKQMENVQAKLSLFGQVERSNAKHSQIVIAREADNLAKPTVAAETAVVVDSRALVVAEQELQTNNSCEVAEGRADLLDEIEE